MIVKIDKWLNFLKISFYNSFVSYLFWNKILVYDQLVYGFSCKTNKDYILINKK